MKSAEYLVFIALCSYADHDRQCWPSVSTLVEQLRISERTVYYALAKLEQFGLIKREKDSGSSNLYTVLSTPVEVFSRFFPRHLQLVAPLQKEQYPPCNGLQVTPAKRAVLSKKHEVRNNEVVIPQPQLLSVAEKPKPEKRKPENEDQLYAFATKHSIPHDWAFRFWLYCEQNGWTRSQGSKILPLLDWKKHMALYWRCGYLKTRDHDYGNHARSA